MPNSNKNKFSVNTISKKNIYKHRMQDAKRREQNRGVDWRESNPTSKSFISNKPAIFLELDDMKKKVELLSPTPPSQPSTFESGDVDIANKNLKVTMSDGSIKNINIGGLLDNININSSEIDETNKKLIMTLSDGSKVETDITGLINGDDVKLTTLEVQDESKTLSLTLSDGTKVTGDISKLYDKVSNSVYDSSTKKLTLTLANGTTIDTDLSSLADNKFAQSVVVEDEMIKVTMSDGSILETDISSLYDNVNVADSSIDDSAKKLTLTLSNGTEVSTDISSLYDNINTTGVTIDEVNKKLKTTLSNGTIIETDITNLLKDELLKTATIDVANKKAVFTMSDNSTIDMDVTELLDNINLTSGEVDTSTNKLKLTLTNGNVIEIDATELLKNIFIKSGRVLTTAKELELTKNNSELIKIDITDLVNPIDTPNHLVSFAGDWTLKKNDWIVKDNNLAYGVTEPKQAIHINKKNTGLILQDKRHTGFSNEVDGQLVNFGTNFNQLGKNTRDDNYTGAWFRVDTRTNQLANNLLALYHQPPHESELIVFNVGASGKLNLNGIYTSIIFNNKVELAPRIDYKHLNTVATFINGWKAYGSQKWRCTIMRTGDGMVNIVGIVVSGSNNTDVCVLPPQYRPQRQVLFNAMCQYNQYQRVDIYTNGELHVSGEGIRDGTGWVSLQVSYYAGV